MIIFHDGQSHPIWFEVTLSSAQLPKHYEMAAGERHTAAG